MSKNTISERSQIIRNESGQGRNNNERIANVIDDLNQSKIDKADADQIYVSKDTFNDRIADVESSTVSGIKGEATPTSSPTPYIPANYPNGLFEKWEVKTVGTYTNFKDASTPTPQPLQVSADDLKNNLVQIWVTNGVSQKVLSEKLIATPNGAIIAGETKAISGDTAFKILVDGETIITHNDWEPGYYFNTGAASTGTTYSMQRTPKILLKKGQTLKFGVNTFNVSGSTAAIFNLYNLDGSLKTNVFKQTDYINQFKQHEITATEDVYFALCDFSTATYGTKFIEIHSVNKAALNPLDGRVTTLESSQNEVINGATTLLPEQSIPVNLDSYYLYTGATGGTGSGHKRTDKFLLKKGRTINYGVNVSTSISSYAILNLYKLDGTFLANIKRPETPILSTFYTGSYTALEDVLVGISDYTTGAYGTAFVKIVAQQGSNYNKGLTKIIETDTDKVLKSDFEASEMYKRGRATMNLTAVKKYGLIIWGQSNTEGRVPIAQLPSYIASTSTTGTPYVPNVKMWNDVSKTFADFQFGVNTGHSRPGQTSTLVQYAFDAIASYLLAQNKAQTIYLVKRAQGGTAISPKGIDGGGWWTPRFENITSGRKLLEELKIKVLNALAATPDLEFKAVIFHQGESDSLYAASVEYYQNLKEVIEFIRGIVGIPNLPFIFGTIPPNSAQYSAKVNEAFNKIATDVKFVYLVDMSDGALLDPYHFDAVSTQAFGQRVFDILKTL